MAGSASEAAATVRAGSQSVEYASRRPNCTQPATLPVTTHASGSCAVNRLACRSQDAA